MLDHKVSPLLDAMEVGECFASHDGASCYRILHPESGREFVLKHISVPAGEEKVEALLLSGAYANQAEADAYYRKEAESLVREAEDRKKLLDCPYILPFLGVQMEKKEGVGYDVYAVLPKRNSLETYLNENAVSHLRGINMGIDLCAALGALREEGFVHANLKPGNVFFSDSGRFLLGDFGLISTEDMQYAVLPEQYRSSYSAPELSDFLGGLNPTVDIYSLGMILYRIYNGNHAPFEDEKTSARAADARRVAGEALPAPLYADYELTEIILKACAHDPADRYQSPEEMRVELEQYMRRNAVSDHLIVPPLVTDAAPLTAEAAGEQPEPVRFTDPAKLDEGFKKTFAPDDKKASRAEKQKKQKKRREEEDEELLPLDEEPILSDEPPQLAADRRRLAQKLKKARQRRRRAWIIFAAAMVLIVTLIGLYEFTDMGKGLWHYFVNVDKLEVADVTADSFKLRLTSNTDPDDFTALCQDAYGNSFNGSFHNGVAVFTGLNPNTQYNLKVDLPGLHKLSGETAKTVSTKARTEIVTFAATPGSREGSVHLDLMVRDEGAAPAFWTVSYGTADGEQTEALFAGQSFEIDGLSYGETYVFTLVETDNLYLSGETSVSFTPSRSVEADELKLDSIRDGEAVLSWRCTSDLPEAWTLTCTDADGKELPVEIREAVQDENGWFCSASIPGIVPEERYTVKLTAAGLPAALQLEFRDDIITLEAFTAEATANGLSLKWTASREPESGWRIVAAHGEDWTLEDIVSGGSCLMAVVPDTSYTVTLERADGGSLEGNNSLEIRSKYSQRFVQMGLTQKTTIGTYYTPSKEGWTFSDLGGGTVRYKHDDSITFVITTGGWPVNSDEEVTIHYVVLDAKTEAVVGVVQEKRIWNEMWNGGNRWMGQIPWLPETPGDYIFTIFINSQRVGKINFELKS